MNLVAVLGLQVARPSFYKLSWTNIYPLSVGVGGLAASADI